eukprot:1039170-Rhodomonas_salina.4
MLSGRYHGLICEGGPRSGHCVGGSWVGHAAIRGRVDPRTHVLEQVTPLLCAQPTRAARAAQD